MAYVSPRLDSHVARMAPARNEVRALTRKIGRRAEANLLEHRNEGHSQIEVTFGRVDGYVTLNDDRGDEAAGAIERGGTRKDGTPIEGLFILGRAVRR